MTSTPLIAEYEHHDSVSSKLETQVVNSGEGLSRLLSEWGELHSAYGMYAFTDPALVETWWHIRGEKSGEKLHIVTCRQNGRLVAIAPLSIIRKHGLRFLRWAGGDMFDYCDSLATNGSVNRDLWHSVRKSTGYDLALLKTIQQGTSTHQALASFARRARMSLMYAIHIGDTTNQLWRKQASHPQLRRKLRKLESRGSVRLEVVTKGPVPDAPFAALIRQKTEWAAQLGKVGLFDDPQSAAAILRGLAEAWGRTGNLHLSWLQCGEHIIAVHLGCVFGERLYWYMPSYDANWSDFSPGHYHLVKLIEWADAHGMKELDFLRGGDAYKQKFANFSREFSDFTFPGSVVGRIAEPLVHRLYFSRQTSDD